LKTWEGSLGSDLVAWQRGKRARLSGFGEKLLFAEQRAKARALPELEKLLADMEREFPLAFDPATPISVSASKLQLPSLA
jgi:putative molybdopterin biosynthesis protein